MQTRIATDLLETTYDLRSANRVKRNSCQFEWEFRDSCDPIIDKPRSRRYSSWRPSARHSPSNSGIYLSDSRTDSKPAGPLQQCMLTSAGLFFNALSLEVR
jgi:hypothetical protein